MNDNEPVLPPPSSFPLDPNAVRHIAAILAKADGSTSLERLLGELSLLPAYELAPQDNGMVALSRLGGEGSLLLIPTAALIPMMAETVLRFMVPSVLHAQLKPDMNEAEITLMLAGAK